MPRRPSLRLGATAREAVLALAVLVITFLNFGHGTGVVAAALPHVSAAVTDSWCGDVPAHPAEHELVCHVCRIGGAADLPPPPLDAQPADLDFCCAEFAVAAPIALAPHANPSATPRGPPLFA